MAASHVFIDKTIAVANTAEQKFTVTTHCTWWAVMNTHATATLFVKTDGVNATTNAIPILAGQYKIVGITGMQANGYDLQEYQFVSATIGHTFTVEFKIA